MGKYISEKLPQVLYNIIVFFVLITVINNNNNTLIKINKLEIELNKKIEIQQIEVNKLKK